MKVDFINLDGIIDNYSTYRSGWAAALNLYLVAYWHIDRCILKRTPGNAVLAVL